MGRTEQPITAHNATARHALALRDLRDEAGLTTRGVAESARLSPSTASAALAGKKLPTEDVHRRIVAACGGDADRWHHRWTAVVAEETARAKDLAARKARAHLLPPSPLTVQNSEEFTRCMRMLRVWAGNPTVRSVARRMMCPTSTLHDMISGYRSGRLPHWDMLAMYLRECGLPPEEVDVWR